MRLSWRVYNFNIYIRIHRRIFVSSSSFPSNFFLISQHLFFSHTHNLTLLFSSSFMDILSYFSVYIWYSIQFSTPNIFFPHFPSVKCKKVTFFFFFFFLLFSSLVHISITFRVTIEPSRIKDGWNFGRQFKFLQP